MGVNLKAAAAYIHAAPPAALDGLYHAVKAKCDALAIPTPGGRDNLAAHGEQPNVNVRGILQFVDGVKPLPEPFVEDAAETAKHKLLDTDEPAVTHQKLAWKVGRDQRKQKADVALKAAQADHDALRKLLGTLQARFKSSGYTPKTPQA